MRCSENRRNAPTPVAARFKTIEWQRLRCRVTLETPMAGVTVDIRTKCERAGLVAGVHAKGDRRDGTGVPHHPG